MKYHILHLFLVLICAALSMGVWVLEFSGQALGGQVQWLGTIQYSIFLISALGIVAYLHPFFRWGNIPAKSIWWAGVELYATLVTAILVSRLILFSLFTHFYGWLNAYSLFGLLLFLAGLTAYSFYSITLRRLLGVQRFHIFLLAAGLVLIVPLSWGSIWLLPSEIAKASKGIWEALKMGYPFFWLTLVFGGVGWLSIDRLKLGPNTNINPEILDDGL